MYNYFYISILDQGEQIPWMQIAERPQDKIVYFPSSTKVLCMTNALVSANLSTGAQLRWTAMENMCLANGANVTPCVQAIL